LWFCASDPAASGDSTRRTLDPMLNEPKIALPGQNPA
jgi:hypothetical protein